MFENGSSEKRQSLLMRGNRSANGASVDDTNQSNVHVMPGNHAARAHQRAKASRQAATPNVFLSALSAQADKPDVSVDDEAVKAIERDVDALMEQNAHADSIAGSDPAPAYEPPVYAKDDAFKPLIDPSIMLQTLWQWRLPIVGLTLLGGIAGAVYAMGMPRQYTAFSTVLIDPREVELVERDLTPEFLGNEAALAIVDSQLQTVISTPVLERVIKRLNLDQNADFNGDADSGIGLFDGIAFVRSLFGDETPVDTTERITLENLRNSVSAVRTARTFVFEISAEAKSPRLASNIANAVTDAFVEFQSERQSEAARNASTALGGQIGALKQAVEDAEQKAAQFAQDNDLTKVEGLTVSDTQLVATAGQLTAAKAATIAARSLAEAAQDASVDQVLSGGLPPALVTPGLTTFRAQFASLSQNAASLEQALGPRHPRLANAIAARDAARDEIAAELRRIIAGTQADLRSAVQNEQQIAAALAQAKAQAGTSNDAAVKLRELEAEIEAARTLYKAALLRAGETNQLEALAQVNASIIAQAEPPLSPSSVSRKIVMAGGAIAGLLAGLGLAFLAGLRACLRADNTPHPTGPQTNPNTDGRTRRSRRKFRTQDAGHDIASTPPQQPATASNETNMYPGAPFFPFPPHQLPVQQQPAYQGYAHGYPQPQPTMAYPQPPMMQPHYMPQPVAPNMGYPMGYPTMPPQPVYMHMQQPAPAQEPAPTQSAEQAELEELRASVRDIRDVVDHLTQSRGTNRRFG